MKFDLAKVDLNTHKIDDGRSYLDINPKGYVPALQFDDGEVLTENVAILSYIADKHPALIAPSIPSSTYSARHDQAREDSSARQRLFAKKTSKARIRDAK